MIYHDNAPERFRQILVPVPGQCKHMMDGMIRGYEMCADSVMDQAIQLFRDGKMEQAKMIRIEALRVQKTVVLLKNGGYESKLEQIRARRQAENR